MIGELPAPGDFICYTVGHFRAGEGCGNGSAGAGWPCLVSAYWTAITPIPCSPGLGAARPAGKWVLGHFRKIFKIGF